jgi:hypothetical protein
MTREHMVEKDVGYCLAPRPAGASGAGTLEKCEANPSVPERTLAA